MRQGIALKGMVGLVSIALLLVGVSIASAAKPVRTPAGGGGPIVHGDIPETRVCAFPVETSQPDGNYTQTEFSNTRLHITGTGHDRATNLDTGATVTLPTSGKVTQTVLANGDLRFQASGRTLLYFYPGDVGPFGPVEANGGLYYFVGQVDEILSSDFFVTSFEWSGKATDVCSLIE